MSTTTVEHPELVQGNYLFTLETRTLDDIREIGGNTPEDDLRFRDRGPGFGGQPGALPHVLEPGGACGGHRARAPSCIRR